MHTKIREAYRVAFEALTSLGEDGLTPKPRREELLDRLAVARDHVEIFTLLAKRAGEMTEQLGIDAYRCMGLRHGQQIIYDGHRYTAYCGDGGARRSTIECDILDIALDPFAPMVDAPGKSGQPS